MAHINVPDHSFRQSLINTIHQMCTEYMFLRASAAEIKIFNGEADRSFIFKLGKAHGILYAAKKLEKDFTGQVTSCTFVETKVENMLMRDDTVVAIKEMLEQVKQSRGY